MFFNEYQEYYLGLIKFYEYLLYFMHLLFMLFLFMSEEHYLRDLLLCLFILFLFTLFIRLRLFHGG
jgi:hypothetical protein